MSEVNTVVIGGGHTGLAMSFWLRELGIEHTVIERGAVGQRWRNERWDSLTLLTPNWATQLPGLHYDGTDPDGFETRDGYVSYLERYSLTIRAPVQEQTTVESLNKSDSSDGYTLRTSRGVIEAKNVVIATGPFHTPHIPDVGGAIPKAVLQIHTSQYRNPQQLPNGSVLVVGGGNSGLQIAEELAKSGRRVYLSVGRLRGAPRRYRGKDLIWWLIKLG